VRKEGFPEHGEPTQGLILVPMKQGSTTKRGFSDDALGSKYPGCWKPADSVALRLRRGAWGILEIWGDLRRFEDQGGKGLEENSEVGPVSKNSREKKGNHPVWRLGASQRTKKQFFRVRLTIKSEKNLGRDARGDAC